MAIDPITGTPYEERLNRAISAAGTESMNPEAVRQALAKDTYANDTQLKEAQGGQQNAIAELAQADQKISQMFRSPQGQATQTFQPAQAPSAAYDPNNPQATIAQGPMEVATTTTPQQAFAYNPFVEEALKGGQTNAATGAFSMADMARAARERYLGTEIDQMVNAYKFKLEEEKRLRDEAEKKRLEDEAQKMAIFERQRAYAEQSGGEAIDPVTGQKYSYKSKEQKAQEAEQSVFNKIGKSGKSLIQEVTDGLGNFRDIIAENPMLNDDEKVALAKANVSHYGSPFVESNDTLRQQGLGFIVDAGLSVQGPDALSGKAGTTDFINKAFAIPGAAELIGKQPNKAMQEAMAQQIVQAGSVEAYNQKNGSGGQQDIMSIKDRYGMTADDSKKVMDGIRLITSLKDVKSAIDAAIGGKQTGRFRDLGIGTTGFLSQFAGTGGSDPQSQARSKINDLQAQIRNNMFGSALSAQEIEQANKILPTTGAQEQDNLNRLTSKMDQKVNDIASTLRAYGVSDQEIQGLIGGATTNQQPGGMVTMTDPSGNSYQVDPSEAAEAEANGWRRM